MYNLTIFDPEDQCNYELILNEDDFVRAQNDEHFLNQLLRSAKSSSNGAVQTLVGITSDKENKNNNTTTLYEEQNSSSSTQNIPDPMQDNSVQVSFSDGQSTSKQIQQDLCKTIIVWDYEQTKALIRSMSTHIGDLNHVKKCKFVYENIANDLLSAGYTFSSTTVQNKWKSLVRSYQKCKDIHTRTGQGPSRFYFFEEMDEILGLKPTNSCSHSLNSFSSQNENVNHTEPSGKRPLEEVSENNLSNENSQEHQSAKKNEKDPQAKKKFLSTKMEYMQRKIKEYDERRERHKDKMNAENRRAAIEERKLEMLNKVVEQNARNKKSYDENS